MLMKIDIKQLIEQSKAIQKIQEKTIEDFAKIWKKYLDIEVNFELNQ